MSVEQPQTKPSFWQRLIRFIIRLLFVFVVGIALGAGIFFGAVFLFRQYVQPVQSNSTQVRVLEIRMEQVEGALSQRNEDFAARLDSLELQGDKNKELYADLDIRLTAVEQGLANQAGEIHALSEELQALQSVIADMQSADESLQDEVNALQSDISAAQDDIQDLQDDTQALLENIQLVSELEAEVQMTSEGHAAMKLDLQVLRAMALLTRSRMHLAAGNTSLARVDIAAAREMLVELQSQVPEFQAEALAAIIERLDAAFANLPRSPVIASDRLEGAWQLLFEGLPDEPLSQEAPTAAEEETPEATPTPAPSN
jgi:DNA repair exonuclease SbcCD ATPase subunit